MSTGNIYTFRLLHSTHYDRYSVVLPLRCTCDSLFNVRYMHRLSQQLFKSRLYKQCLLSRSLTIIKHVYRVNNM